MGKGRSAFPHNYLNCPIMKKYLLLFLLGFTVFVQAQQRSADQFEILPGSSLSITGDTNITDFSCGYDMELLDPIYRVNYLENEGEISFRNTILKLKNSGFDCGSKGINKDFHALLQSDQYPMINLKLLRVQIQDSKTALAIVAIGIAGQVREYEIPVQLLPAQGEGHEQGFHIAGQLQLNISDYGLQPPKKLFGIIVVKDDIQINFNLHIQKASIALK